jgi:hypothetical protein
MSSSESFCKVCFDAGKPESEYTSHFVKSEAGSKGKVVCPTLLSMDCTYCKMKGHMKSYCAVLKKNVLERKRDNSRAAYSARLENERCGPAKNEKKNEKSNAFSALCGASDSEDEKEIVEDFPALCQDKRVCVPKKKNASTHAAMSYATMVQAESVADPKTKVLEKKVLSWVEMNEIESDDDDEEW